MSLELKQKNALLHFWYNSSDILMFCCHAFCHFKGWSVWCYWSSRRPGGRTAVWRCHWGALSLSILFLLLMLTLFCCCCCCWCPTVTFKICTDGVDLIIQLSLFNYYYSIITIKLSTPIGLRCWCCCETRSASPTSWRSTGTPLPSALYHQHHGHRHNVHHGHHGHHHHDQELFHQQQGHSIHRHCYNSYVSQLLYTAV